MANTALLIVDLQNDYFGGGKFPLDGIDAAA
ncbi:MAG TPA: cysteine hydrolase, partial [Rhodobacteraceae bacterium]|nr:cysteine hydrolase [Paracoccaceae bacterium]